MRLSVVLQTRLAVSALGLMLVAVTPLGAQEPQEGTEKLAIAESVIAREEAASERAFDPAFRTKAKEALAALPLAALEAQTGENGLGLNSLGDSQADLVYTPLTPCRIIDTRLAGGILVAGVPRDFKVTGTNYSAQGGSATSCGVPFGPTTAAAINFVAVTPQGAGHLLLTPFGRTMPLASIINYALPGTGLNVANGLTVATCDPSAATCSYDITIEAGVSGVHLVGDVQGYYQRVSTGGLGTALLADAAVTAPKISAGTVVRSLNSQTDAVTLVGSNGLGVTQGSGTVTVSSNATASNTGGAIVARDASGDFSAGSVGLAGNLGLPNTTSTTVGVLTKDGTRFLHNFGTNNTFVGSGAGNFTLTAAATANSAFGSAALQANTTGSQNSAFGSGALSANTTGYDNSAFGGGALPVNTTGNFNSAFGASALYANTTGYRNSAFGDGALNASTTGIANSAFGYWALLRSTTGGSNSAFGDSALSANTTGNSNSALGYNALGQLTTGAGNVAVGVNAGVNLTSGSYNVYIANLGVTTESNTTRIGYAGQTATYITGIYNATVSDRAVYVNSSGQLGTLTSSRRYKEEIVDMEAESDVLLKLRPVSFYYRPELDDTHLRQYGLVAEEVAEVAPGLVAYDADGAPQTVRYHFVNAMLLNEVQKQRRQLEAQDAEIRELRAQESKIRDLEARLAKLEADSGDQ